MLQKINIFASYLWALSCFSFAGLIGIMTKFLTHDPNLSIGKPEHVYLIPMLAMIAVGFASFGTVVLTWIIAKFKKIKLVAKHFWISAALVTVLTLMCVTFLIGFRNANFGYKKGDYTGQQLFDAINTYRADHGKTPLVLDQYICDNLVARYLTISNSEGHDGFEDWYKGQGMDKRFSLGAELYIKDTSTTADAIKFWDGSPGHRLSLLGDFSVGCAYANNGTGVVVVGEPVKK